MSKTPFSLENQHILITGASSGIGKESAIQFAKQGAKLTLIARDEKRLQETLSHLEGTGHNALSYDLSNAEGIPQLMKDLSEKHGRFHGIFHAAGIESVTPITILKESVIDSVFGASIKASLFFAKALSSAKVRAEGPTSLVLMSSISGSVGEKGFSVYAASKAAIDGATRSLACELAEKQIRINTIVAGAVKTAMHERMTRFLDDTHLKAFENKHLLGFGESEDIANAALFLLSPASKWITGTTLVVDGGYTCQ